MPIMPISDISNRGKREVFEHDVVVVGSGAAALAAAVTAAHQGLNVLVVEKASHIGGTGALSGGVAWVPNNPHIDETGRDSGEYDSRDRAMRYFESLVGRDRMRPALMEAFYNNGRRMVEFLESRTQVQFERTTYPDYKAHLDGGMPVGRSISVKEYDGRLLGDWFDRLQPPMKELCLLDTMMVDGMDVFHLMNMSRSLRSVRHVLGRFLPYVRDRVRYGRGARLTMGNALIARLMRSALDAGVTLWTSSPALRLQMSDGQVTGVVVAQGSEEVTINTRCGVVLGAGGFPHDEALKQKLIPFPDQHQTMCPETNSGDGLHMGMDAGGHMGDGDRTFHNYLGSQITMMRDPSGRVISKIPFLRRDRNKPGFVLVNRHGRRFVNEAWPYNDVAHAMETTVDAVPAYLICDHAHLRRYGLGLVRPGPAWARPLGRYLASGHLVKGRTLAELASKLGIDAEGLKGTVANMNEYALSGKDLEFHKGETAYDRWQGDPLVKPNPSLGPVEKAPFYAITLWPGNLGTLCGLVTDERARVLTADEQPIPGLYAVGGDMHSVFTGSYPGGGGSIGPGMTFGFIAGEDLALNRGTERGPARVVKSTAAI